MFSMLNSVARLMFSALLTAIAFAQSNPIAFSSVPAVVVAGSSYNITWAGGDGSSSVTITLRKGNPANLATIGVLADGLIGYSHLWDVSSSFAAASDYALQITQGQSEINYSGLFSIAGETGSSNSSSSGTTASIANSSTSVAAKGSNVVASTGTGSSLTRNTTFSAASVHQSLITATATIEQTSRSMILTSARPTESTSTQSGEAVHFGSAMALIVGLSAAVMCLG